MKMIAIRDPKTESERPTRAPDGNNRPAPVERPEAANDDDPLAWRESDFAPVKLTGEGKSASEIAIEDRGGETPASSTRKQPGESSPLIYPEKVDAETMRRSFDFKPEKIRGKPLSETVIEDRRAGW